MVVDEFILAGGFIAVGIGISYLRKFSARDRTAVSMENGSNRRRTLYDDKIYLALPIPVDKVYALIRYKGLGLYIE